MNPNCNETTHLPAAGDTNDRRALLAGIGGLAAGALLASTRTAHAGPLNPPAGPIVSTGKTLTDIEPRTALVNPPSGRLTISAGGSYYLAQNVTAGIDITADNVTLDLNGFTASAAGGTGVIVITAPAGRLAIRNGIVRASAPAQNGIVCGGTSGGVLEDLIIARTIANTIDETGIRGFGAPLNVRRVRISGFTSGISTSGGSPVVVEDADVTGGASAISAGSGASVRRCRAAGWTTSGISVGESSILEDCIAQGQGTGTCFTCANVSRISRCVAFNSSFAVDGGQAVKVEDCVINACGSAIRVESLSIIQGCLIDFCVSYAAVLGGEQCQFIDNKVSRCGLGVDFGNGPRHVAVRNLLTAVPTPWIATAGGVLIGPTISSTAGLSTAGPWANIIL